MLAATHGDFKSLRFILRHKTFHVFTLHSGYYEVVDKLIEKGAHVNAVNNWGTTALSIAIENGNVFLLESDEIHFNDK